MAPGITELVSLTTELSRCVRLDQVLQTIVDRCAPLLGTSRVSIRLFDPTQTRLIATCRAGKPLHQNATNEYRRGEGLIGWIAQQGKPLRSDDAEADPRFVARPDMVDRMGSFVGAPVVSEASCIGVISAVSSEKSFFTAEHEGLLQLIAGICAPHIEVARISRLAQIDTLTGAFNRRGLEVVLPLTGAPELVTLVMADIDHFKAVNDRHGHPAGDEVLKRVARLLSEVLRAEDAVVRVGGEEFLLVLPSIDLHQAVRVADRTRALIEATPLELASGSLKLTISAGVAQKMPAESRDEAIARADAALYRAKTSGRNRVLAAQR